MTNSMRQIALQSGDDALAPRVTEESRYPNIDTSYTVLPYTGQMLSIRTNQRFGIKVWGGTRAASQQGVAIHGNLLVSFGSSNTHYIYTIGTGGTLTQVGTLSLATEHSNALQFAPTIESGQTFPYLYVAGLDSRKCYVVSIAADYTATIVQTITTPSDVYQAIIGDDGYIWGSGNSGGAKPRVFTKFRKVAVSEGDVTLTADDIIDQWATDKIYNSDNVTAQGWSVKYGKIWFCYGAAGAGKLRGVDVYDTANHRRITEINLTDFTSLELEDLDFYDNSMILATVQATIYELRF